MEAETVVHEIRSRLDLEVGDGPRVVASDFAILFRTNEQPRLFETELRRSRVPYVLVGGLSFYDRKEVKDLLCYLRTLANPHDEVSLLRILNTPPRGICASSIETLLSEAVSAGQPMWTVLPHADEMGVPAHVATRISGFCQMLDGFRARLGSMPLQELIRQLLSAIDYKAELQRIYKTDTEIEARWASVEELVNSIAQYEEREEAPTLLGFLEQATLSGRDDEDDDDKRREHAVTLMTLHSAKGLEFPHVYLVGLEEGILPHKRSVAEASKNIEEERRLCYVGVTRARETLSLSFCKTRMKWGRPRPCIPSRFLMEMRGETEKAARAAEAARAVYASPGAAQASDTKLDTKQKAVRQRRVRRAGAEDSAAAQETAPAPVKVNARSKSRARALEVIDDGELAAHLATLGDGLELPPTRQSKDLPSQPEAESLDDAKPPRIQRADRHAADTNRSAPDLAALLDATGLAPEDLDPWSRQATRNEARATGASSEIEAAKQELSKLLPWDELESFFTRSRTRGAGKPSTPSRTDAVPGKPPHAPPAAKTSAPDPAEAPAAVERPSAPDPLPGVIQLDLFGTNE